MIDQPASAQFDGQTFIQWRDHERLSHQLAIVRSVMADGRPHTLAELAEAAGASVASVSARCRDLRKAKFGGHCIERSYVANGIWQYRMQA